MDLVRVSRRMAFLLRHDPASVGLELSPTGAVPVRDLAAALGVPRGVILGIVEADEKGRFVVEGSMIRAAQGHSVQLEQPVGVDAPVPDVLFHGTVWPVASRILRDGLQPMGRQFVHLSGDVETARAVAARRRGAPVVLVVDAAVFADEGHDVFMASNGVWQAAPVPSKFIRIYE